MTTRTVALLHAPTSDGRVLLGVSIEDRKYPVYAGYASDQRLVGTARVKVIDDRVEADIQLVEGEPEPPGVPVISLVSHETSTLPYREDVDLFHQVSDEGPIQMVGRLGSIFYDDNPAWPELKR